MCGIIAVIRRPSERSPSERSALEALLAEAIREDLTVDSGAPALDRSAAALRQLDAALRGPVGARVLAADPNLAETLRVQLRELDARLDELESTLDATADRFTTAELETINRSLVLLRDASWAVHRDRLRTAEAIAKMAGVDPSPAAAEAFWSIQSALSALDRLEVRGRDSAGLHVLVHDHDLDLDDPAVAAEIRARSSDPLFRNRAVRITSDCIAFAYKRAAEIGELGDNVAALRESITTDHLLRRALENDSATVTVLGHTRWASVGIISEANAHPLNHEELADPIGGYVSAALNGDVDNHLALVEQHGLKIADEITTDAKVIPALMSRRLADIEDPIEAFRQTVREFEGSVAIGASPADRPDELLLALRGSGQALYIGLAEDAFVVASEPYGVIEECNHYLRMDGETPGNPAQPAASRGQIVRITRRSAGTVQGVERIAYDGTALPVTESDLTKAAITTRDVDRGDFSHYLLKEISESPRSFRKTLRGKIAQVDGRLRANLDNTILPTNVRQRLADGSIRRILTIGQGTAAVAGQGVAAALQLALADSDISVAAMPATELSGFSMRADMSDTLIVAISQSGTTTDTNRTVDLVRGRGALVLAIVNRRGSDLTDKADGVLYTSDGRDVEMSVASTKAFYAQIAAGFLLSFGIAREAGCMADSQEHELLTALRDLPEAMIATLAKREEIAEAARDCTRRRYWALVGNGSNRIAAQEIRIKLSELCYKSIACDATEDKKHIDLSSEPMILVCAAGLRGSTADDVQKEVAIYKAHKALPVVIADEGEARFDDAHAVISVPRVNPSIAFVLSTVAGHLFGYEVSLAIDALADPLRRARSAIERNARELRDGEALLESLSHDLAEVRGEFTALLRDGRMNGTLEASTAVELDSLLRFATGSAPLELFQIEHGEAGTPGIVIESLTQALTQAIEELTRPIDAIKHQAKTVTVGISRSDESLLTERLVAEVTAAGTPRDCIGYHDLRTLAALGPAVASVKGFSRYAIHGDDDDQTVVQIGAGGIAAEIPSRTKGDRTLRGTKHQVAREKRLLVATGRRDGRTFVLVPEVENDRTVGLVLLHVDLVDFLSENEARDALASYRDRLTRLTEVVMETEPSFQTATLAHVSTEQLLTGAIGELAESWREVGSRDPR